MSRGLGKLSKGALLGCASAMALQFGAYAQDTANADDEDDALEEIVVTGVRASILNSRNRKLNDEGIVDAFFAEEIGKSTDEDIASALQRLPGVTLERGGPGGDQGTVVVRGIQPALNLVKFNGVTLTSGTDNQAVDLTNFSADVLSSIVVAKSPSASQDEGSLGGTIFLNSAAPLDADEDIFIVGIEGRYNDLNQEVTPRATFNFSTRLKENFGISASFFYDDSENRVDSFEAANPDASALIPSPIDLNGNTLTDRLALVDSFAFFRLFEQDTRKVGGTATVQWQPGDSTEIRLDVAYSDQNQSQEFQEVRRLRNIAAADAAQLPGGLTQIDPATGLVVASFSPGPREEGLLIPGFDDGDQQTFVGGLNVEHQVGRFTFKGQLGYSRTDREFLNSAFFNLSSGPETPAGATFGPGNGLCGFTTEEVDGIPLPAIFDCNSLDFSDPSTQQAIFGSGAAGTNDDEFFSAFLDASYDFDDDTFLSSIDVGFKYSDRAKDRTRSGVFFAFDSPAIDAGAQQFIEPDLRGTLPGLVLDESFTDRLPDNFATDFAPLTPGSVLEEGNIAVFDIRAANEVLFPGNNGSFDPSLLIPDAGNTFGVDEEVFAAYVQANFQAFGGDLTGNIGLRYVHTDVTGVGGASFEFGVRFVQPNGEPFPQIVNLDEFVDTNSYDEFLPSLNLNYRITDEWILRGSVARALARPALDSLQPGFFIQAGNVGTESGFGGNTGLDPFVSDQFDISLEYYFSDTGFISAAVFHKSLDSFTFQSVNVIDSTFFGNPVTDEPCLVNRTLASTEEEINSATVAEFGCATINFTQEVNGASASITGLEVSYTQTYDFLPGFLQYLGANINYTFADSEQDTSADEDAPENGLPFFNTSRNSINSVLFWDNSEVSLRLAYTWRDEALINPNQLGQTIFRDSRGILDFAANWFIREDLQLSFSAINLTNSNDVLFQGVLVSPDPANIPVTVTSNSLGSIPRNNVSRLNAQGRSFRLGARYTF